MPVDLILAVAADGANLSAEGKLNILGVFDVIHPPTPFPFVMPSLYLAFIIRVDAEDFDQAVEMRIIMTDEQHTEVAEVAGTLRMPPMVPERDWTTVAQVVGLGGPVFHRAGTHFIRFFLGNHDPKVIRIHVNQPATGSVSSQ